MLQLTSCSTRTGSAPRPQPRNKTAPNYSALLAHCMQVMVYLLIHFNTRSAALLLPSLLLQVPPCCAVVLCQQYRHENELTRLEIHAQLQALLTLPSITSGLLLPLCNTLRAWLSCPKGPEILKRYQRNVKRGSPTLFPSWAFPPRCSQFAEIEIMPQWPLTGHREPGFIWCKSVFKREDADCCQECVVSKFLGHYLTPCSSSERGGCNSICLGGVRTFKHQTELLGPLKK